MPQYRVVLQRPQPIPAPRHATIPKLPEEHDYLMPTEPPKRKSRKKKSPPKNPKDLLAWQAGWPSGAVPPPPSPLSQFQPPSYPPHNCEPWQQPQWHQDPAVFPMLSGPEPVYQEPPSQPPSQFAVTPDSEALLALAQRMPPDMAHAAETVLRKKTLRVHGEQMVIVDCITGEWDNITPIETVVRWLASAVVQELRSWPLEPKPAPEPAPDTWSDQALEVCAGKWFAPALRVVKLRCALWRLYARRGACRDHRQRHKAGQHIACVHWNRQRAAHALLVLGAQRRRPVPRGACQLPLRRALSRLREERRQTVAVVYSLSTAVAWAVGAWQWRHAGSLLETWREAARLSRVVADATQTRGRSQLREALGLWRRPRRPIVAQGPPVALRRSMMFWLQWSIRSRVTGFVDLLAEDRPSRKSDLRRSWFLWRLHGGRQKVRHIRELVEEFGKFDDLFIDITLGVDAGMLVPGVPALIEACVRLWLRVVQRPGSCGCEQGGDRHSWLRHMLLVRTELGTPPRTSRCANNPPKSQRSKLQPCLHQGCRTKPQTPVACRGCTATYCSPECLHVHHHERGHDVLCGLMTGDAETDTFVTHSLRRFGQCLADRPDFPYVNTADYGGPMHLSLAFVGRAVVNAQDGPCEPDSPDPPCAFLHARRVERVWARIKLIRRCRELILANDFEGLVKTGVASKFGGRARRPGVYDGGTADGEDRGTHTQRDWNAGEAHARLRAARVLGGAGADAQGV